MDLDKISHICGACLKDEYQVGFGGKTDLLVDPASFSRILYCWQIGCKMTAIYLSKITKRFWWNFFVGHLTSTQCRSVLFEYLLPPRKKKWLPSTRGCGFYWNSPYEWILIKFCRCWGMTQRWISSRFWWQNGFVGGSCIIFQDSLLLADRVQNDSLPFISAKLRRDSDEIFWTGGRVSTQSGSEVVLMLQYISVETISLHRNGTRKKTHIPIWT